MINDNIGVNKNNNEKKDYEYIFYYYDDTIPGNSYEIYFNEDYNFKVVQQPHCSTVECINGSYYPEKKDLRI